MQLMTWIRHPKRMWFHHQNPPQPPTDVKIRRGEQVRDCTVVFWGIDKQGLAVWEIVEAFEPWYGDTFDTGCQLPPLSGLKFGGAVTLGVE